MVQQATPPTPEVVVSESTPAIDELAQLSAQKPGTAESPVLVGESPAAEVAPAPITPAPKLPETPAVSTLPPEVQEYIANIEQQAQSAREQNEQQLLNQTITEFAQRLEQQYGLAPEQATAIAKIQGDMAYRQYQSEQMRRGQVRAAISIAKEFGVDPVQLLDLQSPLAMRQAAQRASATTKQANENTELRARVAALEKGRIPAQNFSQATQPGAGAGLTGDALEVAWLKHETTQPNRPNPYDSAYRAMLRG